MEKYVKISKISLVNTFEYRVDFLFDLISKFFPAVIQFFMWTAIFHNSSHAIIMNYSYHQMILYTVLSIFVATLLSVDIHWEIATDIKNGSLSKYLILPVSYFLYKVFQFIGSKIVDILIVGLSMAVVMALFQINGFAKLHIELVAIFVIVAMFSVALQFLIYYCIAGIAFWIGDCGGIFTVVSVVSLIISGAIFPLDIFGPTVVRISMAFPFYYVTYFPTNVIIGKESIIDIIRALAVMSVWIVALYWLLTLIWKKGMKKYIAAGG